MSATGALAAVTSPEQIHLQRPTILHVLEATSAGAARFVADVLLHHDIDAFAVSFAYSLIRSDQRFLKDLEQIQKRGVNAIEIPMTRNIHPSADATSLARLYRLLQHSRFDIVHSHSSKAGFLGRIAAKLAHSRTVTLYSPHAIAISVNPIYRPIEKLAGFFTDAVVAVSRSERDQLEAYRIVPSRKLRYVTAGIDLRSLVSAAASDEIREWLAVPGDAILIGTAGRLANQKDPFTFLRVAEIVCRRGYPAYFVWAGDGELHDKVLQRARALDLEDRVRFTGYCADLQPILASLDVFLSTSLYESFGYVTCEAMALGKPVVATNVAGSNELVRHGETGFLVEVRNADELASRVISLVENPVCRRQFGLAGQRRAEAHYNLARMVRELEDLYRDLLLSRSL